jgi:hypothetical protein
LAVTLPNYVLVEAEEGVIKDCLNICVEHWTDLEIAHIEASIYGEGELGIELEPD